jgi:hypothetical protein
VIADDPRPRSSLIRTRISFAVALCLLIAAGVAVGRHTGELRRAIDSAASAPWWLVALALTLPLLNWLLMSASFWVLMRRHGSIDLREMACLIATAWLLNYLPLRPGLLGRVAYHKTVNGIPVARSVQVTITSIAAAGVAIGVLIGLCAACATLAWTSKTQIGVIVVAPVLAGLVLTAIAHAGAAPWWLVLTVVFRYIDLLVWVARYLVVFALIGQPLTLVSAAAIASVAQVAMLVPLVGNGLGLREWAVGAVAGALPPEVLSAGGRLTTAAGLAADLVNRVAEVTCAVPIGLACAFTLAKTSRARDCGSA